MVYIYVLQLEQDKFYVGKTDSPDVRINSHFNNSGSAWTKKYRPIKVQEVIDNCDDYDEDKMVLKMMEQHGIDNVRGGSFSQVNLTPANIKHLNRMLRGSKDECFKCGSTDHFVQDCLVDVDICFRCFRKGHLSDDCFAKKTVDGGEIGHNCYRCGREGHWKINCRVDKDMYGRELGSKCIVM